MGFLKRLFGLGAAFPSISIDDYKAQYHNQKNHILIDVRTPGEFKQGHVLGAKNYPLDRIAQKLDKIPQDKTIVVMCRSGNRSHQACHVLARNGYEQIINLRGGTIQWEMAGNRLHK